jgi:hypothetical protein
VRVRPFSQPRSTVSIYFVENSRRRADTPRYGPDFPETQPGTCLTQKTVRLGFAPVRVDQRDSRAKYFPGTWRRFSFPIDYRLSAINSLQC